ncbi:trypsin 3A1-like [Leptinotarsa decemlineata]|uniref:trypsin 3A1-like n=1 Tax=Leptinotarsa decemlineata TaxID=7539 RepID=UPI003D30882B
MFALCSILSLILLKDSVHATSRIIGGRSVQIEEFPYQLSLRYNGTPICGAALITKDRALTVAHCFRNKDCIPSEQEAVEQMKEEL